ncbi:MAG: hypothetical protein KC613_09250, partial [Myxococcales bacterium]|nr:hypothetical protein [Myxococcales bacterium]
DDEYNPDGALPVIAYCEGEDGEPLGVLDPAVPRLKPTEIMLAVDLKGNGRRDAMEPVIRNLGEPYADVGCDGIPSPEEPGYDPVTNPDPAGDDYHWYRNGAGTEGNGMRDGEGPCGGGGEPFDDVGIDGVPDTPQSPAGYDLGEGNGRFDPNPNLDTFWDRTPGLAWAALPPEARDRVDLWLDGGIRDIFNFGLASVHMGARLQATGLNVRLYRDFPALLPSGSALAFLPNPNARDPFGQAGEAVVLAYGDPNASPETIAGGDGAHVGSADQTLNRFMTMFDWVHNRWPDGDYTPSPGGRTRSEDIVFDSPRTGRKAHYVVTLPPGYDEAENAERRYPVTLLLHGYGQRPDDLPVAGALLAGAMTRGAWQKAILVYPDGSCGRSALRQCNDGVDNDGDGALDAAAEARRPCGDGLDACAEGYACRPAGDGAWCCPAEWADCGPPDPECRRGDTPAEDGSRPTRCADGVDNDLDGAVDLEDGGCMGDPTLDDEAECKRGSFYTTHVAARSGEPGGPDYEAMLLDMLDDVDRRFRTKAPEVLTHPAR